MAIVSSLTETLVTSAFAAGLTGLITAIVSWTSHRRDMTKLRIQRSEQKADEVFRAVDTLELMGPVPGPLLGGQGPHAGTGVLPDLPVAQVAVAAVNNAALLIADEEVRKRVHKAIGYLKLGVLPGGFKTLPLDYVWPDVCSDIRNCVAAYTRGDKTLPDPPPMYEHYDQKLAPLLKKTSRAADASLGIADRPDQHEETSTPTPSP